MKILFICKHNRFRSQVAEAIFNTLNKNPNNSAESAGLLQETLHPFLHENTINILAEKGYSLDSKRIPRKATPVIWEDFDKMVIVADNVNAESFPDFKGEIEKWDVPDCDVSDLEKIKEIVNLIESNVKRINK